MRIMHGSCVLPKGRKEKREEKGGLEECGGIRSPGRSRANGCLVLEPYVWDVQPSCCRACFHVPGGSSAPLCSAAAPRWGREAGNVPSSTGSIFASPFLFLFHGNFGAPAEHCCFGHSDDLLPVSNCLPFQVRLSSQTQNSPGPAKGELQVMGAVPTVSHIDPLLPGAKPTSFWSPLGAGRWWGRAGGPFGYSPLLDYPPSSGMTAASSATQSSFAKLICDLVGVVRAQGSVATSPPPLTRCPAALLGRFSGSRAAGGCRRSGQAGTGLGP